MTCGWCHIMQFPILVWKRWQQRKQGWFSLVSIIHRSFNALVLRTGGPPSTIPFRVTLSFQLMGVSFSCDSDNLPKDVAFVIFCHFIAKVWTQRSEWMNLREYFCVFKVFSEKRMVSIYPPILSDECNSLNWHKLRWRFLQGPTAALWVDRKSHRQSRDTVECCRKAKFEHISFSAPVVEMQNLCMFYVKTCIVQPCFRNNKV